MNKNHSVAQFQNEQTPFTITWTAEVYNGWQNHEK